MIRRIAALLMLFFMFVSVANAQEPALPEGVEMLPVFQAGQFDVPEGLEPMYELMRTTSSPMDVYLARMPHGRALLSLSYAPVDRDYTAEELLELWPQARERLRAEVVQINADEAAVSDNGVEKSFYAQAELVVGEETTLTLQAECAAMCMDGVLMELWAVYPADPIYLYDEAAAFELDEDCAVLASMMYAPTLAEDNAAVVPTVEWADPQGRFQLQIPVGSSVITAKTPMEEVAVVRDAFIAANEEGAAAAFDQIMKNVYEQQVVLMVTGDGKGIVEIGCSREASFAGATPDMLCALAEPIRQSLAERFGLAMTLVNNDRQIIDEKEHSLLTYWVRSGECDLQLDVMATVVGEDWLCEADIYTVDGDQQLRQMLHALIIRHLHYTVE